MSSKHTKCCATVKQFGKTFMRGNKEPSAKEVFTSAGNIIQNLITEFWDEPFLPMRQVQ